jgi:dTDP-4-amino-4,6-dideoxygalactose transaminase
VIVLSLNCNGMIKIARRLDLVPVPADLDVDHFAPRMDRLEAALSPRSKVLVVAHLFGCVIDMEPIVAFAKRHKLVLVEDCAQVFDGHGFEGHPQADLRMFSFGPLKTATALGGALIRVRDRALLKAMRDVQAAYPVQKNREQLARVLKFLALKNVTFRVVMGALYLGFRAFNRDFEDSLSDKVRSVAKLGSSQRLRFQPSAAMLKLMVRRITAHRQGDLAPRTQKGEALAKLIGDAVVLPGQANDKHSYWVFPLIVDDPRSFIERLRQAGFDCADLPRSQAVEPPPDRPETAPVVAATALRDLVIVPCYPELPDKELARLAGEIKRIAADVGNTRTRSYAQNLDPSKSAA